MIEFDKRGNITPSSINKITLEEFENIFVTRFPESKTRQPIFAIFKKYLEDFKTEVTPAYKLWINGSFVTTEMNPKDIDFVVIFDKEYFDKNKLIIDTKYRKDVCQKFFGTEIDAFVVRSVSEDDKDSMIFKADLIEWAEKFSHTRLDWRGKKHEKGFVEIEFK